MLPFFSRNTLGAGVRVLVTGGAGFVGSALWPRLVAAGHEVLVVDDLSTGVWGSGHRDVLFQAGAVGDPALAVTVNDFAPHRVFHLAARHYIPWCDAHPGQTREVNVSGLRWLLRSLEAAPLTALVFASSAAVYGFSDTALPETAALRPTGSYGESKREGERILTAYARQHPAVRVAAARLFNVFGPGDRTPHVIPRLFDAVRAGEPVTVGNLWPLRDYVFVEDVVDALLALGQGSAGWSVHNVAKGQGDSVLDVLQALQDIHGVDTAVRVDPARVREDDGHLVGDISRIRASTGWFPRHSLRSGLEQMCEVSV